MVCSLYGDTPFLFLGIAMRNKTACFTGHRKISESERTRIVDELKTIVEKLINDGYSCLSAQDKFKKYLEYFRIPYDDKRDETKT